MSFFSRSGRTLEMSRQIYSSDFGDFEQMTKKIGNRTIYDFIKHFPHFRVEHPFIDGKFIGLYELEFRFPEENKKRDVFFYSVMVGHSDSEYRSIKIRLPEMGIQNWNLSRIEKTLSSLVNYTDYLTESLIRIQEVIRSNLREQGFSVDEKVIDVPFLIEDKESVFSVLNQIISIKKTPAVFYHQVYFRYHRIDARECQNSLEVIANIPQLPNEETLGLMRKIYRFSEKLALVKISIEVVKKLHRFVSFLVAEGKEPRKKNSLYVVQTRIGIYRISDESESMPVECLQFVDIRGEN